MSAADWLLDRENTGIVWTREEAITTDEYSIQNLYCMLHSRHIFCWSHSLMTCGERP